MKITVKTELLVIEVEDNIVLANDGHSRRSLPEITQIVTSVINDVIKANKELKDKANLP